MWCVARGLRGSGSPRCGFRDPRPQKAALGSSLWSRASHSRWRCVICAPFGGVHLALLARESRAVTWVSRKGPGEKDRISGRSRRGPRHQDVVRRLLRG